MENDMSRLNGFCTVDSGVIATAAKKFGTPFYLYDEGFLIEKCKAVLSMPNAYGLEARYAMKANSNKTILQIINDQGFQIDASSLNEAKRAALAGIPLERIMLTTQEVPEKQQRKDLEQMMLNGMKYNVCSLRQLHLIGDFAKKHGIDLAIRVHPGLGTGESASRNTGDDYSCFGVHLTDIEEALAYAQQKGIKFTKVHTHIGSGGNPEIWKQNVDLELNIIQKYFHDAKTVSFGGGLKEARMPDEHAADIIALGNYAKQQIEKFYQETGTKLSAEIEPGTFIAANLGYAVTKVVDKKKTGPKGLAFAVLDGGMDINCRPLMYGSRHPFYVISKKGVLLSSEYGEESKSVKRDMVVVGTCCESGDSQCLNNDGHNVPRVMAEPEIGDIVVVGGAGAYCSSMAPFNYNSHVQIPEVLYTSDGQLQLIRKRQTLKQMVANEI
jgi:diaminopimelate decarboxylase